MRKKCFRSVFLILFLILPCILTAGCGRQSERRQEAAVHEHTAYALAQMKTGDRADIYFTTYYDPDRNQVSDKRIDLSGYAFINRYSEARLSETADTGFWA